MKRVKRSHGLLPKAPQKGEKITVVGPSSVHHAYVRRATGGRKIEHRRAGVFNIELTSREPGQPRNGTVYRKDEGITWARGWDTKEADALRVAVGLCIRRGDAVAVVSRDVRVEYGKSRYVSAVVLRRVTHVTKRGKILIERGGWFVPEEEGLQWARAEHADALRVAVALAG